MSYRSPSISSSDFPPLLPLLDVVLVVGHHRGQLVEAGEEEPLEVVDIAEDVEEGQGHCDVVRVDVETY